MVGFSLFCFSCVQTSSPFKLEELALSELSRSRTAKEISGPWALGCGRNWIHLVSLKYIQFLCVAALYFAPVPQLKSCFPGARCASLMKGRNLPNFCVGCNSQLVAPPSSTSSNRYRENNWGNPNFNLKYSEFPAPLVERQCLKALPGVPNTVTHWTKTISGFSGPRSLSSWLLYAARWRWAVLGSVRDTGPKLSPLVPVLALHAMFESSHIIQAIFLMNLAWEKYEH